MIIMLLFIPGTTFLLVFIMFKAGFLQENKRKALKALVPKYQNCRRSKHPKQFNPLSALEITIDLAKPFISSKISNGRVGLAKMAFRILL